MIAQIRDEIRERVRSGSWKPGMLIPSRRTIADEFKVNRMTVQRALLPLLDDNTLVSDGRGTFVADGAQDLTEQSQYIDDVRKLPAHPSLFMRNTLVFVSITPPGNYSYRHAPGWMHVLDAGVIAAVRRAGLHVMTLSPMEVQSEEWEHIIQSRPMGVIVGALDTEEFIVPHLKACEQAGIPVTVFGDTPEGVRCDLVASDHRAGAYNLTKWLIGQGKRRILLVIPRRDYASWPEERRLGYEQALREEGLEPAGVVETRNLGPLSLGEENFEDTARLLTGYLAPHVLHEGSIDAIMAASDGEVPSVAAACRLLNKTPNTDIVIVGYDNYWNEADTAPNDPAIPLATVDKGNFHIGEELVRLTVARARGQFSEESVRSILEPRLLVLGSRNSG